jgi:hypothetical protein
MPSISWRVAFSPCLLYPIIINCATMNLNKISAVVYLGPLEALGCAPSCVPVPSI